jgi:hypothetical protein
MYVMPGGCNADAALEKDADSTFGHLNTNNAHLSN